MKIYTYFCIIIVVVFVFVVVVSCNFLFLKIKCNPIFLYISRIFLLIVRILHILILFLVECLSRRKILFYLSIILKAQDNIFWMLSQFKTGKDSKSTDRKFILINTQIKNCPFFW